MLLSNLNLLATAPGGVARLRELILTLAVQGKLVPQDPKDEPASELLKKIRTEKDRLIAEGKIKRDKPQAEFAEEEKPFGLPQTWEWVRLGEIGLVASSSRVHQSDWKGSGVPFYRAREIVKLSKDGHVSNDLYISEELFASLTLSGWVPEENDIMITGVGTIGIPYVVQPSDRFYFKDASVLIFKNFSRLNAQWLSMLMRSPLWIEGIHEYSMGTTVDTLTISRANIALLPLPPAAEQSRIVTRVEELMRLCDALEAKGQLEATQHAQLLSTLLATLTDSETPAQLTENWHRIATHFDLLLDRPEAVDALEQTIFGLAMHGMLVDQDLNDEPTIEVVKRIAERRKQTRVKSVAGDSGESDTDPYSLPQSWVWCNVEQIATVCLGGTPARQEPSYWNGAIPWVSSGEVANGRISDTKEKITPAGLANSNAKLYPKNTVLIAMIGQGKTRGQSAILEIEACTNQNVAGLILEQDAADPDFIFLWALHEYVRTRSGGRGGAQPALNGAIVRSLKVPLPPLAEQSRIVTRVAQLRRLCADLRQRLAASQSTQAHLADALVVAVS